MREIIKSLNGIKGENVNIHTVHKLFGEQHIEMKFKPETEIGLGFHCKEQVIYIDNDDVIDYCVEDDKIVINGSMMCITIVKQNIWK